MVRGCSLIDPCCSLLKPTINRGLWTVALKHHEWRWQRVTLLELLSAVAVHRGAGNVPPEEPLPTPSTQPLTHTHTHPATTSPRNERRRLTPGKALWSWRMKPNGVSVPVSETRCPVEPRGSLVRQTLCPVGATVHECKTHFFFFYLEKLDAVENRRLFSTMHKNYCCITSRGAGNCEDCHRRLF